MSGEIEFPEPVHPSEIPAVPDPGLYALFAEDRDCLPGIAIPQSRIVYVGMSGELASRNHFQLKHSGFSSPRRSLGAILREELDLRPVPRSPGPSETNVRSFKFADEGEERLTAWMIEHFRCSILPIAGNVAAIEKQAIVSFEPPLNLTAWRNPQKPMISALRKACSEDAKRVRSRS